MKSTETVQLQRILDTDQSYISFEKIIKELGYDYHNFVSSSNYQLIKCAIYHDSDNEIVFGFGKGTDLKSKVLASFEALQHLLSNPDYNSTDIIYDSLKVLEKNYSLLKPNIIKELIYSETEQYKRLSWLGYREYRTKQLAALPLVCALPDELSFFLKDDEIDYSRKYIQASDNGIASGYNCNEALLYSILELIERHAVSTFLIDSIIGEKAIVQLNLSLDDLSLDNKRMLIQLQNEHNLQLQLIEIPTPYNLYTVGAILRNKTDTLPYKGFKTTYNQLDAAEAAIEEAIQDYWIDKKFIDRSYLHEVHQSLENHTLLQKCLCFDIMDKTISSTHIIIPSKLESETTTADSLLPLLIDELYNDNRQLYYRKIYSTKGYYLVQAIIPTFEEFCTILYGNITFPNSKSGENK